ncbi:hypothetical protein OESDEN_03658 [Oesophagostomum dentatum]|uniref:SCP domain-containing protein n=1 Tax=Oesophagostomum dentatum TaxID=61180 RepID=A0A0B1TLU9_OESDE|nr:hypothetical protein OESDEN_03658 [Oesophagostomum dentatum]
MWGFAVIAFALIVSSFSEGEILLLLFLWNDVTIFITEIKCPTVTKSLMTPKLREQILEFHNHKRAKLASGLENNKNGKLPGAKNMYKLVGSDCFLEEFGDMLYS